MGDKWDFKINQIIKLKKQYAVLGCYIDKTPIDLYPIKNLKLNMLSSSINNNSVFMVESYRIFATRNKSDIKSCTCNTIDSSGMTQIIFEGDDLEYLKENVDQILCCKPLLVGSRRLKGVDLVKIDDYILNIGRVYIMIQNTDDMIKIKQEIYLSDTGSTSMILYVNNEYLNVGKFVCTPNALESFSGMKWVADA